MHIIICGQSRSGSTLLYNLLRENVANFKFYDTEISALRVPDDCDQITKRPLDLFEAKRIKDNRKCRFIATMRDPRDILTSVHTSVPNDFFCDWDYQYFVSDKKIEKNIPGLIPFYEEMCLVEYLTIIKYEDIVCYPEELQVGLSSMYGFAYHSKFSDWGEQPVPNFFHQALNGVRPLETSNIGRWTKFPERIKEQFEACPQLFEIVKEFGYEDDDSWFENV